MNLLKKNGEFRDKPVSRRTKGLFAEVGMLRYDSTSVLLAIGTDAADECAGNGDAAQFFDAEDLRELATELNRIADALERA